MTNIIAQQCLLGLHRSLRTPPRHPPTNLVHLLKLDVKMCTQAFLSEALKELALLQITFLGFVFFLSPDFDEIYLCSLNFSLNFPILHSNT